MMGWVSSSTSSQKSIIPGRALRETDISKHLRSLSQEAVRRQHLDGRENGKDIEGLPLRSIQETTRIVIQKMSPYGDAEEDATEGLCGFW